MNLLTFNKKLLITALLIFVHFNISAATFVVTSNADSGPGTLRDALTQAAANGNGTKDQINFNLADQSTAGRTIILLSNLPAITSDVIIDGSTQPGSNLSTNGAKIIIQGNYKLRTGVVNYIVYFLIKNVNSFEMDGLIIKGLYKNPQTDAAYAGNAIMIDGTNQSIVFGQPGKGNVIYDVSQAMQCATASSTYFPGKGKTDNVSLKSNFIGVKEDGITIATSVQSTVTFNYAQSVTVGGDTRAEGNVFYGVVDLSPSAKTDQPAGDIVYKVRNNIFGANALQQKSADPNVNTDRNNLYVNVQIYPIQTYNVLAAIDIRDNVFGCELNIQGFQKLTMQIQHNFFGTSSDQLNRLPIVAGALYLRYMQGTILVGGNDVSLGNTFTNCVQDTIIANGDPVVTVEDFGPSLSPPFKVALSHNSFYCNNNSPFAYSIPPDKKPLQPLSVDNLTTNAVNGTAVPGSNVELFYTDINCSKCQPKVYINTVKADADGTWSYNSNLLNGYGVMASATIDNVSSEFTDTRVYVIPADVKIINVECAMGGSIAGVFPVNAKTFEWINAGTHQIVGTDLTLSNVPVGKYRLKAEQFGCVVYSDVLEIIDATPAINSQAVKVTDATCGKSGAVTGITGTGGIAKTEWLDAKNTIVGTQYNINNLGPGNYTFRVTGPRGCIQTYPVTIKNTGGPSIDQSKAVITPTNCGSATGSITNMQVTGSGPFSYNWTNEQQQVMSATRDLTNVPAGKYILQVIDQSGCGSAYSSAIVMPEVNGVVIDTTAKVQTPTRCLQSTGSITNIKVTGAISYQWIDANGNTVSTQLDLTNAPAGKYYLIASNTFCSKQTMVFTIVPLANTTNYGGLTNVLSNASCGLNDGSIEVVFIDNPPVLPVSYRWANSVGQTVGGNSRILTGIDAGTYQLYVSDSNGCEKFLISYTIGRTPGLNVDVTKLQITDDHCETGTGSIRGISYTGKAPVVCTWTDASNNIIGNAPDLMNVKSGTYIIKITDASGCEQDLTYTIQNKSINIALPSVNDVQLCSSGTGLIAVNGPAAGYSFRLYKTATSTVPIADEASGRFKISVDVNRSYYIGQYTGNCEGGRAEVKVSLGLTKLGIANTFTPNNDGTNDTWNINGISNFADAVVQVYNRVGQKVFESKGYAKPFDGKLNGQDLPAGVYYYIINLNIKCDVLSGSLTIVR